MANDGGEAAGSPTATDPTPVVRWRRALIVGVVVIALGLAGVAALRWWRSGCHDDYCTGSRHDLTITVNDSTRSCWNNISNTVVGTRMWESFDHAPDEWGLGPVSGSLVVTSTPISSSGHQSARTATFTADQGGSVTFHGGIPNYFSMLNCSVHG